MEIGRYFCNDPAAPKPNSPTHIGTNVLLEAEGRLLLEKRWDCGQWGLVGGRLRDGERYSAGIARELREETGISLPEHAFHQIRICDDDRIASYRDGTVWRMVIVLFRARLERLPELKPSAESLQLQFFTPEELSALNLVITHRDLILRWAEENGGKQL